ncbi:MAG: hypothetical protein AB8B72_03785 [Crocinitomicaceae bacterium]
MSRIRNTVFSLGDPDGGAAFREFKFLFSLYHFPYDIKAQVNVNFPGESNLYNLEPYVIQNMAEYSPENNRVRLGGQLLLENRSYGNKYCFSILKYSGKMYTNSWVNTANGTVAQDVVQNGVIIGYTGFEPGASSELEVSEPKKGVSFVPEPLNMTTCVFTQGDPGGGQSYRVFAFNTAKASTQGESVTVTITVDTDNLSVETVIPVGAKVDIQSPDGNRVRPVGNLTYTRTNYNGTFIDIVYFNGALLTNSWLSTESGPFFNGGAHNGRVIVAMYEVSD